MIVDIKDMNPDIYQRYTGKSNKQVKSNLKCLVEHGAGKRIICRIPLISGYNDAQAQEKSKEELSMMGQ